jgi:hypothetical protein
VRCTLTEGVRMAFSHDSRLFGPDPWALPKATVKLAFGRIPKLFFSYPLVPVRSSFWTCGSPAFDNSDRQHAHEHPQSAPAHAARQKHLLAILP